MTGMAQPAKGANGVSPGKISESKLTFRVRRFLDAEAGNGRKVTELVVLEHLLHTYREYQRKPQGPFRRAVAQALEVAVAGRSEGASSSESTHGKRRRHSDSEDEEMRARRFETAQSKTSGANLLNQNLSRAYIASQPPVQANGSKGEESVGPASTASTPRRKKVRKLPQESNGKTQDADNFPPSDGLDAMVERPKTRYADLGGIEEILQDVKELIEYPLTHPEIYAHLGVEPPRGILLHGPPGCGKTLLANAIAGECGVSFLKVSAPEIVSGMSGESEQKLRSLFEAAVSNAPSILFIDEIDAITPKREQSQRGMEKRLVAQLLLCMDSLTMENTKGKPVIVLGATNRPDALDPALRRAGRFDREICLGIPDEKARARILRVVAGKLRLAGDFDFDLMARKCAGYVGADLVSLTKEAAVNAINRIFGSILRERKETTEEGSGETQAAETERKESMEMDVDGQEESPSRSCSPSEGALSSPAVTEKAKVETTTQVHKDSSHAERAAVSVELKNIPPLKEAEMSTMAITMEDFLQAVKKVQPSAKREGFATVPNVSWEDIGALAKVREELVLSVLQPILYPERFEALGLAMPAGVLLYGPPGCGKTLLAKAVAKESGANFISVKGPELLDKYVGESERAVRQVFVRARASSPCVVFFDELDALCPRRGSGDSSSGVTERVVNQLLTELDGMDSRRSVFVIAATNRPDIIDPAMLRPGRLDKLLYVPLPEPDDRVQILTALVRKIPLASEVDIKQIAHDPRCNGFSGADLAGLVREAGVAALRSMCDKPGSVSHITVDYSCFEAAFENVFPSVSAADHRIYNKMKNNLRRPRLSAPAAAPANVTGEGDVKAGEDGSSGPPTKV